LPMTSSKTAAFKSGVGQCQEHSHPLLRGMKRCKISQVGQMRQYQVSNLMFPKKSIGSLTLKLHVAS